MRYILTALVLVTGFIRSVISAEVPFSELDRVKEALLEAAMEKGISVVSNAYINGNGELIESSFYRSEATLRGIRMPQYFLDEPYDAKLLFSDTALNRSLSCQELSPHKYRKAIAIDTTSVLAGSGSDREFGKIIAALRSEITMSATAAIAESSNYYVIPISFERATASSGYERALSPRSRSVDPENTNFVLKAQIVNLKSPTYSARGIYDQGLVQAQRAGKFVANGFKKVMTTYPKKTSSTAPSLDFDLEITLQRVDSLKGVVEETVNKKLIKLRFDTKENKIKLREPLTERLTRLVSRIDMRDLTPNETSASARDLAFISASLRSVLGASVERINCDVEELKTYRAGGPDGGGTLRLNQGLVAGINIGDRFILSESNFSTSLNPISSDQLEDLALAEVIRTSQFSSDIRILEGPDQDVVSLSAIPF
jgi:hypothetical protein